MDGGVCPGFPAVERVSFLAPIMSRPEVDEGFFAYVAVASHTVSLVLI